jgi:hypothetical protein
MVLKYVVPPAAPQEADPDALPAPPAPTTIVYDVHGVTAIQFFQESPPPPPPPENAALVHAPLPPPPTATTLTLVTPDGAVHEVVPAEVKLTCPGIVNELLGELEALLPTLFVAYTVNVYALPEVKPLIVIVPPLDVLTDADALPGLATAV